MSLFADQSPVSVMERPKKGRPRKDVATESVRLNRDILEMARTVVALRRRRESGLTIGEYLSKMIAPNVERDFRAEKKRLADED